MNQKKTPKEHKKLNKLKIKDSSFRPTNPLDIVIIELLYLMCINK